MREKQPDLYYGVGGLLTTQTEEYAIYAKQIDNGKWIDYYIRHAVSGPDTPHLLNPWGVNFLQGVSDKRVENAKGKRRYEFRKVPKNSFDMYISFLETRNERYYRQAERSLD